MTKPRFTTEQFISKARKVHGDKYDYSKFTYTNSLQKSLIICPKHGEFLQQPNNHLSGQGCMLCTRRFIPTTKGFISQAQEIHGDRFDYSQSQFIDYKTKIIIICPIHGKFQQGALAHLNSKICPKCCRNKQSNTAEFITKASQKHNHFYSYEKVQYINCHKKVEIICPKHGPFWQKPTSHLKGERCRKCFYETLSRINVSKMQTEFLNFLGVKQQNCRIGNFVVDGLDGQTIIEFLGDYWHGNPARFSPDSFHPHCKTTHKEVYIKTFQRLSDLVQMGYKVKYIWEHDWKQYKRGKSELKIIDFEPTI